MPNRKLRLKKKNKQSKFAVYPKVRVSRHCLHRVALVYWGSGPPKEYRLDHLSNFEVRRFWVMSKQEQSLYLRTSFNRHHRKPRCQKGPTTVENLSYVDMDSHISYNKFISVVAKWSLVPIEKVLTAHIRAFLGRVYPSFERIVTYNGAQSKIKSLEFLLHKKTLDDFTPYFLRNIARWAGIEQGSIHMSDVRRFIEQVYPCLKRLATDHTESKLLSLNNFAVVLNEIWLPVNEPIFLRNQ